MKSLFVVMVGVFMVLGFLAPVVLSQEFPYVGYTDTGTAIQSGSRDSSMMLYEGIGGRPNNTANGTAMGQQNSPYGHAVISNPSGSASTEPSGQSFPGGNGYRCLGVAGGVLC